MQQFLICDKKTNKNFVEKGISTAEFFIIKRNSDYIKSCTNIINLITLHKDTDFYIFRQLFTDNYFMRVKINGVKKWHIVKKESISNIIKNKEFTGCTEIQDTKKIMNMTDEQSAEFVTENNFICIVLKKEGAAC